MNDDLAGARIIIVGAGVAGLCLAVTLSRSGARCVLLDPASLGDNASGVAAGMIAPAFESALDPASRGGFGVLREGRDLWPALVGDAAVHRSGALYVARSAEADLLGEVEAGLRREGAAFERLSAVQARTLSPDLTTNVAEAVFTPEDWRLEPLATLHRLEACFLNAGGRRLRRRVQAVEAAGVATAEGLMPADAVILCAGWGSADWTAAAPELAALVPIKGERVRFAGAALGGPVLRTAAGYVAPSSEGAVAGATMASGATDRLTTTASEPFAALARELFPSLADQPYEAAAGVRAGTSDGLPLVGRSRSGVWMAAGFRRNGWTLAPLAARILAAGLAGRGAGPWAGLLRPDRFLPT